MERDWKFMNPFFEEIDEGNESGVTVGVITINNDVAKYFTNVFNHDWVVLNGY